MNFITDIWHNINYSFARTSYRLAIFMRGEQYVQEYLTLMDQKYESCINCGQGILWIKNIDAPKICIPCIRKTCLTFCTNCKREIYTKIQNHPTHLEMDYCEYCITDLSEETKNELNHERVCVYNKRENNFTLFCKK